MRTRWLKILGAGSIAVAAVLFGVTSPVAAETPGSGDVQDPGSQTPDSPQGGEETPGAQEQPDETPAEQPEPQPEPEPDAAADASAGAPGLLLEGSQAMTSMSTAPWVEQPNERISGQSRFETAVAVSKHAYPNGAPTVLIATGRDYPDALSAAALGAKLKAPLLLADTGALPAATAAEITRLHPSRIVIIGGKGVIDLNVEAQLKAFGAQVSRAAGANRYETSIAIARAGWQSSSGAFIATGAGFADALSAGAAAGSLGVPVILVPGTATAAPASVTKGLNDLGVTKLYIAGGTGAVSTRLQSSLSPGRTVVRYSGQSRYDTSAEIASGVFTGRADTYWATGSSFADALTGAAVAGAQGAPLLLVTASCVPTSVYQANDRVTSGQTYLLGGSGALAEQVRFGNECMIQPKGSSAAEWAGAQQLYTELNRARHDAGLSGFRVADAAHGTPAFSWSRGLGSGAAKINPALSGQQPWAVYQSVAQTNAAGDKALRLSRLMLADDDTRSWLLKPSGGVRGAFSVGYALSGANGYATVIVGANLE